MVSGLDPVQWGITHFFSMADANAESASDTAHS
jgi:hypothetical protein